jgi:RNA polymerase sigma-B factor
VGGDPREADAVAALAVRAGRGDADARELLVTRLRPMVLALARRFEGTAPRSDLEQSGVLGLLAAVEGFDSERGVRFETYATPFVIGEMAICARQSTSAVRVPRSVRSDERDVERAVERFTAAHGRAPSVAELAAEAGLEQERVVEAMRARTARRPVGLGDVPDAALAADDPDLDAVEARLAVGPRLARLDARQRRILALRFAAGLSQREIGERLGISQMHVSRLLRGALEELGGDA